MAHVTIEDDGNLRDGTTEYLHRRLDEWPADAIGVNCSVGPKISSRPSRGWCVLRQAVQRHAQRGLPPVEGRNIYLCSPEYMAQYARRLIRPACALWAAAAAPRPNTSS